MSTQSFLTPTKKYNSLVSSIHSIYRLVNSTYEVKDLIPRLARLISQIFNAQSCRILLLDPTKKYSLLKCEISDKKKLVIDRKAAITGHTQRRILKTMSSVRNGLLLGVPLIAEDIIGMIIIERKPGSNLFDRSDQEILMTIV